MRLLIAVLLVISSLQAGMFTNNNDTRNHIRKDFHQNVSDANSIIKRGEYEKISAYKTNILSIAQQVDSLDISDDDKLQLQKDLHTYSDLVNTIAQNLEKKAPQLNLHYNETIRGLKRFNKKIASIGLYELTSQWMELSSIKNRFVKKPNRQLEKKFDNTWNAIIVTITELYLDDDMEEPLLTYLDNYKAYFKEISQAYKSVSYNNIKKLKPLSYKIKAKFELL